MPFLFVDYDHGNGGEKFCAGISQSAECEKLNFTVYENGRTKVKDCFLQEFFRNYLIHHLKFVKKLLILSHLVELDFQYSSNEILGRLATIFKSDQRILTHHS